MVVGFKSLIFKNQASGDLDLLFLFHLEILIKCYLLELSTFYSKHFMYSLILHVIFNIHDQVNLTQLLNSNHLMFIV